MAPMAPMVMQHVFSPRGEAALARTLRRRPLLAFDFDGTLTPIVARPSDAYLSKAVSARLATLATHLPVAIVTGRSVDDVRQRLGFEPSFIVGSHGAEDPGHAQTAEATPDALAHLRPRLRALNPVLEAAGVTVEDKRHSIALHYRLSRTRHQALQVITEALSDPGEGLRVFGGKFVVNVVAKVAPDKADAVHELVRRSGVSCAIFAGDDVNDEPVFAAAPEGWLTIRVGRHDPRSKARYFLDSPSETTLLLERMVSLLMVR